MKSIYIAITAITFLCACNRKNTPAVSTTATTTYTDNNGNPMLLGVQPKESLQRAPYAEWYNKNYADYKVDSATVAQLKPLLKNKQFEIYMGTWCGDSRREVPRMYKILELAGVPASQVKLIAVDNHDSTYKQSPTHEEKGKNIHRVPDLLVYDGKKEINRIVEHPVVSLEKDLLQMFTTSYEPAYAPAHYLYRNLASSATVDKNKLAENLKKMVQHAAELNSLGYVWMAAGDYNNAMTAFEINAILFPNVVNVYDSLGEISLKMNNKTDAKKYYQRVLELQPGHANATKILQQLK
jgi:tetratricopeptide (TPR) repeat protein